MHIVFLFQKLQFPYLCRSSNLGDFTHDIRMLAALQEEDGNGNRLMDAARRLAGGLSDLLNAVQPERQEVGT